HLADCFHLGAEPGEALHHQYVAEYVAGALGDFVMQLLDLALRLVRLAHCDRVEYRKARHQPDHKKAELPVRLQRPRHHDDDRKQRRQMLTEESEPEPEQIARARMHDAQQAPGMMLTVKRQRQRDGILEKRADRRKPAPMRETIGEQSNPYARNHATKPNTAPEQA